jgi:phosphate transport system protein
VGFHRELEIIDAQVVRLYAMVTENLAAATDSFLSGDREQAREIANADELIDAIEAEVEQVAVRALLMQAPVASEFHHLISVLRIVPELERSGDLAHHIASRASRGLGANLPPAVRGIVDQLGERVVAMWREAADAYAERDQDAADRLDALDDEVDALAERLWAVLIEQQVPTETAMEMALIGRFYERLGDHAMHITARLRRA